jgi:hypothetical protein
VVGGKIGLGRKTYLTPAQISLFHVFTLQNLKKKKKEKKRKEKKRVIRKGLGDIGSDLMVVEWRKSRRSDVVVNEE